MMRSLVLAALVPLAACLASIPEERAGGPDSGSTSGGSHAPAPGGETSGGTTGGSTSGAPAPSGPPCLSGIAECACGDGGAGAALAPGACVCTANGTGSVVLSGTVTLPSGLDPTGTAVALEQGGGILLATAADGNGGYSFDGVPAGTYSLAFEKTVLLPSGFGGATLSFGTTTPAVLVAGAGNPFPSIELPAARQILTDSKDYDPRNRGEGAATLDVRVSPDGRWIAFQDVPTVNGSPTVALNLIPNVPACGPSSTPVTVATGVTGAPAFTADGSWLAFADAGAKIAAYPLAGGAIVPVGSDASPCSFVLSPKGSGFAISHGDGFDLGTIGAGAPVHVSTGGKTCGIEFSPDGSRIAFSAGNALALYTVSTGASVQLAAGVGPDAYSFSPDGGRLVFSPAIAWNPIGTLSAYDISTGMTIQVATDFDSIGPAARFSPDGARLAFTVGQPDGNTAVKDQAIELYDLSTGASQRLTPGGSISDLGFSPDGSLLAFTGGSWNSETLELLDASASLGVPLPSPVTIAASNTGRFTFSPDGRRLAFFADWYPGIDSVGPATVEVASLAGLRGSGGAVTAPVPVVLDHDAVDFAFAGDQALVVARAGAPFDFMDGLYVTPLP